MCKPPVTYVSKAKLRPDNDSASSCISMYLRAVKGVGKDRAKFCPSIGTFDLVSVRFLRLVELHVCNA